MYVDNLKQSLDIPPWEARKRMLHGHSMNQGLLVLLLLPVVELELYQGLLTVVELELYQGCRLFVWPLRLVLLFSSCCATFAIHEEQSEKIAFIEVTQAQYSITFAWNSEMASQSL
jgi:hypothetical protein